MPRQRQHFPLWSSHGNHLPHILLVMQRLLERDRTGAWIAEGIESLAKLLHGTSASASIVFVHVACRDLKLTLAPTLVACPRCQPTESQANETFYMTSPTALMINILPCLSEPVCFTHPLDKTPVGFTKTPLFWFKLTNRTLAWTPQNIPLMDPNKGMSYTYCLSVCTLPWPSCVIPRGVPGTSSRTCEW